ncbi:alpha/beta hydrolase [uncultured Shimia sp.]|uniref:alpha/beta hydrolase n=1 Tax=uncultured Shimia sp. TaxID=573152 RepID=UPI00263512D8|nr:alpha/beta hydrolase [uncultured Shimia sp.]
MSIKHFSNIVDWVRGFFTVLSIVGVLSSCSRAPDLVGVDNSKIPAVSVTEATRQKIFITTTRQATEVVGAFYSGQRAPELGLASVVVSIPPNHVSGELERSKRMPPDPRTEFAVIEPTVYQTEDAFIRSLNGALAKLPPGDRDILFFVHGYNNTISDSILRLAQFVEDTDFKGVPVLFSWASAAQPVKYVYDLNSALAARPQFLKAADLIVKTKANGADIFAHSMGSMLLMEAIVLAEQVGNFNTTGRLKSVMMASPDIDIDVFRSQLSLIDEDRTDLFVLTSEDDSALGFSRRISGGVSRVGASDSAELAELGVTVIDLSNIDDSKSGSHSKFAGSPEVVQLIGQGLNSSNRFGSKSNHPFETMISGLPIIVVSN